MRLPTLALLCCSVTSALRQEALAQESVLLRPEVEEGSGAAADVSFITKVHENITGTACRSQPSWFGADSEASDRLTKIMPNGAYEKLCDLLEKGTLWPDCPTKGDAFSLKSSCLRLPVMGDVPLHEGMRQMGRQMAYQKIVGKFRSKLKLNTVTTFRAAEQHKHGSPLLPLDEDGKHIALVTNKQLKMKMIEQSTQWFCKGSHALADGLRTGSSLKVELGAFFFGKILHPVQDTFTLSHARRDVTPGHISQLKILMQSKYLANASVDVLELLQDMPIQQAYSMDDVSWASHAAVDKGRNFKQKDANATITEADSAALEDAAVVASALVIDVFAELINKAASAGDVSEAMLHGSVRRLGRVLCDTVWLFEDDKQGAGGSLKELGLNGDSSTWTPVVASDEEMRQRVSDELAKLVSQIDKKRKKGKLALDPNIEFRYPTVDDDYCRQDTSLTCAGVGYTPALSEPIAVK